MTVLAVKVQEIERHPKSWGWEDWFVVNELYSGKRLVILKDRYCSLHGHILKDETFYVEQGEIHFDFCQGKIEGSTIVRDGPIARITLVKGQTVRVKPLLLHRFTGLEDTNSLLEFSTTHYEEDSYRVEMAWPIAHAEV